VSKSLAQIHVYCLNLFSRPQQWRTSKICSFQHCYCVLGARNLCHDPKSHQTIVAVLCWCISGIGNANFSIGHVTLLAILLVALTCPRPPAASPSLRRRIRRYRSLIAGSSMPTDTDARPLGINLAITGRRSLLFSRILLNCNVSRPHRC
jgi:hypothetical protein